ncbi:MAG: quinol:cytochrome C oxidoreductase, partial [Chitinophagales bacterium]
VILTVIGYFFVDHAAPRIWSSLMYNNYFFMGIALTAAFFVSAHTVGWGGWYVLIRRVSEAVMMYLPIAAVIMLVILALGSHSIFHWMHEGITDPSSPNYDKIIAGKSWYLNEPFFWLRSLLYLGLWSGLIILLRRNSLKGDLNPDFSVYEKGLTISGIFLFVFAISSSTASWDWFMSITPHWYSTLFGWYGFISLFVSSCALLYILMTVLQSYGYLQNVTDEHFHDVGKFMFAFSIAWSYLFFSQFMLIWYANIPEETLYFQERLDHIPHILYIMIFLNFVTPFFVLMTANAKRNRMITCFVACCIIIGHWLDYFQMSVPGAVLEADIHHVSLSLFDVGLGVFFLGLLLFSTFRALTKASLVPVNHPYVKESVIHHA